MMMTTQLNKAKGIIWGSAIGMGLGVALGVALRNMTIIYSRHGR
jgi:hypothetical protein